MANSSPQHEPTMEEILASIRKIISEDSSEPGQPAAQPVAAAPAADTDVLELTQEIPAEPAPAPAAAPPPIPPAVMAAAPAVAVAPAPAPVIAPAPVAAPVAPPAPEPVKAAEEVVFQAAPPAPAAASDDLVSDKARHDIDDALAGLDFDAASSVPAAAPAPIAPLNGRSIEAIFDKAVRETFDPVLTGWLHEQADVIVDRMKPAIREWMEENLPSMLKAAVEAEVARAVRNRTKR